MSDKWISVEDRLPITESEMSTPYETRMVIGCNAFGVVWPVEFQAGNTFSFWSQFEGDTGVTHWMPLPAPPKPIEHSKPDGSLLKDLDGLVGYKEGEE